MFNWAIRVGHVRATPFKRHSEAVVKMSEEASRSRRLDPDTDEAARLLAACAPHLRAVVEYALETGMRRRYDAAIAASETTARDLLKQA